MTWLLLLINVSLIALCTHLVVQRKHAKAKTSISARRQPSTVPTSMAPGVSYRAGVSTMRELRQVSGDSQAILGISSEELARQWSMIDLVHPDDRELVEREIGRAIRSGEDFRINYRIGSKDGKWLWVSDRGAIRETPGGEAGYIDGHLTNITNRVSAEMARVRAEERYNLLAQHALDVVCVHDADGQFEYVSPSVKHTLGYDPAELMGRSYYVLVHPDDRERVREKIGKRVREDGESIVLQYRIRSKKGTFVPVESRCQPHQDAKGYYTRFVTSSRNITDVRRLKREVAKLKRASEGFSGFENEALRIMSHEIRTPLTGIMGVVDILNEEITGEHRKLVDMIRSSGDRMLGTFKSIMDFSTLDSDPPENTGETIDVVKVARSEADRYKIMAEEKGVTVQVVKDSDQIDAKLDQGSISRILDHLLSNAVKFTPKEGVVTVSIFDEENDVVLRVADTGIGISKEFLPHVYQPFRQESSGLSREFEGVGIGLSIAKRLTEQMHGEISADSEKGKGATFTVRLPKKIEVQAAGPSQPAPSEDGPSRHVASPSPESDPSMHVEPPAPEESESKPKRKLRILAVDDNEPMRLVLRRHLEKDFVVVTAEDGDAAVTLASVKPFDVIILDINLGSEKNGQDVLEEIRALPENEGAYVIAVTAYALPEERNRFLRAGFDGYVSKPFTRATLLREISRLTMHPVEIAQNKVWS